MADLEEVTLAPRASGGAVLTLAIVTMNVTTYGFNMAAARMLGPQVFGEVAALLNVLLLLTVVQLGLQTVAARRIAAEPEHVQEVEASMLHIGHRAAFATALVCLLIAPLINRALHIESLPTVLLIGVIAAPFAMTGVYSGILQGERRWVALALTYLALGVPRLVLGLIMMMVRPTEFSAMAGVAVAAFAPAVVGYLALRRSAGSRVVVSSGRHSPMELLRETARNSSALFAFLALSNVDLLIARNVLDAHEAGLYAGGSLLVKAVLFLPQFVIVLAFPSMGLERVRRGTLLLSLGMVTVMGVLVAGGTSLLSPIALFFVGGSNYVEVESMLWVFAVLGTVASLLQILVYSVIARQARGSVYLVWLALVAVLIGGRMASSVSELLYTVIVIDTLLLVTLFATSLYRMRTQPEVSKI